MNAVIDARAPINAAAEHDPPPRAIETSARPSHRILGSGTFLDEARLRHRLGELLDVERESVHACVMGEHGDSSFPVWSSAAVGAVGLEQAARR
jgi:L-lactate dehydrogenase